MFLIDFGMVKSEVDHNLYFCQECELTMIVLIYVDDLLITSNHATRIDALQHKLENKFEMSKLGVTHHLYWSRICSFPAWNTAAQEDLCIEFPQEVQDDEWCPRNNPDKSS